jgi:hypothetical protein
MDCCVEIINFKSKFGKHLGVSCESEGKMYFFKKIGVSHVQHSRWFHSNVNYFM